MPSCGTTQTAGVPKMCMEDIFKKIYVYKKITWPKRCGRMWATKYLSWFFFINVYLSIFGKE